MGHDIKAPDNHEETVQGRVNNTMDANVWARDFMETFKNHGHSNSNWITEDLMVTWFANAIMCGWDHANWGRHRRVTKEDVLQAIGLAYTSKNNAKKVLDAELGVSIANAVFFTPGIDDEAYLDKRLLSK